MDKRHLFWVIPLCLIIGYLFGLYLGIPNHIDITIDYGDNIVKVMELINETQSI